MKDAQRVADKHLLWYYIKKIALTTGETDLDFLKEYASAVWEGYKDNADEALECFKGVYSQFAIREQRTFVKKYEPNNCKVCGYVPQFCNCFT